MLPPCGILPARCRNLLAVTFARGLTLWIRHRRCRRTRASSAASASAAGTRPVGVLRRARRGNHPGIDDAIPPRDEHVGLRGLAIVVVVLICRHWRAYCFGVLGHRAIDAGFTCNRQSGLPVQPVFSLQCFPNSLLDYNQQLCQCNHDCRAMFNPTTELRRRGTRPRASRILMSRGSPRCKSSSRPCHVYGQRR